MGAWQLGTCFGAGWGGDMRCLFRACKWIFICNVADGGHRLGLYQCQRCKTVSCGSPDGPHSKEKP